MISMANIENAIAGKKILIDTNIIIYLTDAIQPYTKRAQSLFEMIESGDSEAVISILSIGEVMQGPIRSNRTDLALEVMEYLIHFPNCHCQDINHEVLALVANDSRIAWNRLRAMDSLIIASGLANKVDLFISNDKHFKKALQNDLLLTFDK
jgi:predicted nucleic acid-binding protein